MNAPVMRRAQPWLGTLVSIDIPVPAHCANAGRVERAFASAFAAVRRVHGAMSPEIAASDVARFNQARKGATITCDPWTVRVLSLARRLQRASHGLFDVVRSGPEGDAYVIEDGNAVIKCAAEARIDLGGIAKGYAVDRAICALRAGGVSAALVNAGGDLRAFGTHLWPVVVRAAGEPARAKLALALERGGVATSQYRRGKSPFHDDPLIDPSTRDLHRIDASVTVAAPRCATADALIKVVALSGDAHHPLVQALGACAWLH